MMVELTKEQIDGLIEDWSHTVSEADVIWFLRMVTKNRRNKIEHTKIVTAYIDHVCKECSLPKRYFNE